MAKKATEKKSALPKEKRAAEPGKAKKTKAVTSMKILPPEQEEPLYEYKVTAKFDSDSDNPQTNDETTEPLSEFQTAATGRIDPEDVQADAEQKETIPASAPAPTPKEKGVKINKVKLIKDLFLEVEYDRVESDGMTTITMRCESPVHDDFKTALKKLNQHCAVLGNQYNSDGKIDTENITCVGLTIRTGKVNGVKLIANRKLGENKVMNVLPPFTKMDDNSSYESAQELDEAVEEVIKETKAYLDGKHKKEAQLTIPGLEKTGEEAAGPTEHVGTLFEPGSDNAEIPSEHSDIVELAI